MASKRRNIFYGETTEKELSIDGNPRQVIKWEHYSLNVSRGQRLLSLRRGSKGWVWENRALISGLEWDSRNYMNIINIKTDVSNGGSIPPIFPAESKRSCWTDERRMVASGTEFGGGTVYRPKCQPDGSYAPVQCHSGIGFCWCVTPAGKPINHSYVKGKTPHCNRKGTTKGGSECNKVERARFVNNLVYVFKVEYGKYAKRFQGIFFFVYSDSRNTISSDI
ncbi:hypothetical protein AAG570_004559 [Ranatra chinensis]|uniref:Thyroglobulin type-1 domain-containing protein n=1 Tax=Ranatra chinensis TaxID=642074 RepID=A0ABD0Y1I3_9HEMI